MAGWSTALMAGSSLLGGLGGLFSSGGGSAPQRTTTNSSTNFNNTNTTSPWAGISPYFMGMPFNEDGTQQGGPAGVFPEAARLYGTTPFTGQMNDASAGGYNDTYNNREIFRNSGAQNAGGWAIDGNYDPQFSAVTPATVAFGDPSMTPEGRQAAFVNGQVSLEGARESQGVLDPTKALQGFLAGQSANPWAEKQGTAITDLMTRNFKEQVLPGIRQTAIADGQYGGSRGDIANTMAVSRLNTDLAPALTQLASNAYEAEQGRKYGAAMDLNRQGSETANANAGRQQGASQFNAQLGATTALANNSQEMQRAAQDISNVGTGLGFLGQSQGLTDQYANSALNLTGTANDYNWDNLARYGAMVQPGLNYTTQNGAGTSNTSGVTTGSGQPGGGGGIAGAIGGAATGAGIGNALFGNGGLFGSSGNYMNPQSNYSGWGVGQGPRGPSGYY